MFPNVLKIIYDSKQNKDDISSASFKLSNWRPLQIDYQILGHQSINLKWALGMSSLFY